MLPIRLVISRIKRRGYPKAATVDFLKPLETGFCFLTLILERLFAGILHDITERKQTDEANIRQLDELRRWQALMLRREDRNMNLEREVNDLLGRLGEPIRYPSPEGSGSEKP